MDSQFQVKITADISELQSRLKSVEAITGKFKQSMDSASSSVKNMEQNANRGRLVAFAFGQVIRDAGFFAQDFRLGILAISNNIPILIDQLVLASNVSKSLGSAFSLLGSLLTAGLTIWAYSKDSVNKYASALDKARGSAESQIMSFQSLINIAQDETKTYTQRNEAVKEINKQADIFNNKLTVASANSKDAKEKAKLYTEQLLLQAEATAIAADAEKLFIELRSIEKMPANKQADYLKVFDQNIKAVRIGVADFTKQLFSSVNPLEIIKNAGESVNRTFARLANVTKTIGEENKKKGIATLKDQLQTLREELDAVNQKRTAIPTPDTKDISDYAKALLDLSDSLKKIDADTNLSFSEKNKALVDAYKNAIQSLAVIDSEQASLKILQLRDSIFELNKEIYKSEGNKFAVDLFNKKNQQDAKDSIADLENLNDTIQQGLNTDKFFNDSEALKEYMIRMGEEMASILNNGIVAAVGNSMMAIGEAFATGGNAAKAFGAGILASLSAVLSQLADKLIAAGLAGLAFSSAMKNLFNPKNWALALAAGVALKIAAGAAGGFSRGLSGGGSSGDMASPPIGQSGPNFLALPTAFQNGTMSMNSNNPMTLETRISGNDLAIIVNRADKNRNGYY